MIAWCIAASPPHHIIHLSALAETITEKAGLKCTTEKAYKYMGLFIRVKSTRKPTAYCLLRGFPLRKLKQCVCCVFTPLLKADTIWLLAYHSWIMKAGVYFLYNVNGSFESTKLKQLLLGNRRNNRKSPKRVKVKMLCTRPFLIYCLLCFPTAYQSVYRKYTLYFIFRLFFRLGTFT